MLVTCQVVSQRSTALTSCSYCLLAKALQSQQLRVSLRQVLVGWSLNCHCFLPPGLLQKLLTYFDRTSDSFQFHKTEISKELARPVKKIWPKAQTLLHHLDGELGHGTMLHWQRSRAESHANRVNCSNVKLHVKVAQRFSKSLNGSLQIVSKTKVTACDSIRKLRGSDDFILHKG